LFAEAGFDAQAAETALELKALYSRKRAFVDELNKI
jgi:hypothetical protein